MDTPIYLDHHATTPVDPRVLQAMLPWFNEKFGNPASADHGFGWEAQEGTDGARRHVATLVGVRPDEVVFTSGATEADNLVIRGAWEARPDGKNRVVSVATEHKAVADTLVWLQSQGAEVVFLHVDQDGRLDLDEAAREITPETALASVMWANNETGVISPMQEVADLCQARGVPLHTDAAQAAGKIPVDLGAVNAQFASLSAHKMYGPKGAGALIVRRKARKLIAPQAHGGGHERGMRSGTLNVPAIVGFGEACRIAWVEMDANRKHCLHLRRRLLDGLCNALPRVHLNGHQEHRLPGSLNLSFACVEAESLIMSLGNVAVSSGSACTSGDQTGSYVLRAMKVRDDLVHSAIRIGLGKDNTEEEVDRAIDKFTLAVERLRTLSPLWDSKDDS